MNRDRENKCFEPGLVQSVEIDKHLEPVGQLDLVLLKTRMVE